MPRMSLRSTGCAARCAGPSPDVHPLGGLCGGVGEGGEVEAGLLGGDHPEGSGLADFEGVGVAERGEGLGLDTDQVVETGQVHRVAACMER